MRTKCLNFGVPVINLIPVVVLEDQLKKREYGKQIIQTLQKNIEKFRVLLSSTDTTDQVTLSKELREVIIKVVELTNQLTYANSNPESLMESVRVLLSNNPFITVQEKRDVAKNMQYIHDRIGPKHAHHTWIQQKNSELKPDLEEYSNILPALDDLLYGLIAKHRFTGDLDEIDLLLKIKNPNVDDVNKLKQMIKLDQEKQSTESKINYVFTKCKNSIWIKKLYNAGLFSNPPEIKKEGQYIQTPIWPQSQSLISIAAEEQDFVLTVIDRYQYLKNPRIIEDFILASLSLGAESMKKVAELAIQNNWIKIPYTHKLPEHLTNLAVKIIVNSRFSQIGWQLAEMIFSLQKKLESSINDVEGYFDDWMYSHLLEKFTKAILIHQPNQTITLLGRLLNNSLMTKTQSYDQEYNEISYIWRRDLWSSDYHTESVPNAIVSTLMGSLKEILDQDKKGLISALNELEKLPFQLFRRIEMTFYKMVPELFQDKIINILTNEKLYFETNTRGEVVDLLESQYQNLDLETKDHVHQIILEGPPQIKEMSVEKQKSKEIVDLKNHTMLDYLHPIASQLPKNLYGKYQAWVNKFGTPKYEEGITKTFIGPTSPQNVDQLNNMSLSELANYLISWTSTGGFAVPSAEGLGRVLSELIKKEPEKQQELGIKLFQGKARFVYLYHYFWGLEQALKEGKKFDWSIAINVAHDIVNLEDLSTFPNPGEKMEAGHDAVLQNIASLISEGLSSKSHPIPFQLRNKVWEIIDIVTEHEDPTPDHEKQYGGKNMDPHTMSINTTRGEAFHALMRYALWCNQGLYSVVHKTKKIDRLVPEVKSKLEKHLDSFHDSSVAIRSVYGLYFPQLTYLNKDWLLKNIERIFPKEDKYAHLWRAAFETYLINSLYRDTFKMMYENYTLAIERVDGSEEEMERWEKSLAHHLALGYAYNFYKSNELLNKLISQAPPTLQKEFIWFCGSNILIKELKVASKDIGIELPRLKQLWIDYADNDNLNRIILEPFGWWFVNSPFDPKQTISLYSKVLKKTGGKTEPIHQVIPELKNYAKDYPELTINIIKYLVQGMPYSYDRVGFYTDELMEIMDIVKKSGVERATKLADDLIDQFVKSGYERFRELI
ncbi:MAG: hypothetical protein COT24_05465 [Candidatus Kerfeldbacteria bacterium CG08_land_8_20_14_0_20_40_16]|uniref:Uncharacterized protein n=1 Tax=Candidatus Kerfeldbacteria bacterium CG08_land_8_20_14_0_20_40_16 TaxID=2014244 RepID=A0A2H0YUC6_9BACT|nr:MAG: hypothetical protein COT24_05465 [Candidatus Kerfeldbacteria bacterium CG08_land_8_20_14_0_20_40_16]